jgi:hypothetical protein
MEVDTIYVYPSPSFRTPAVTCLLFTLPKRAMVRSRRG